MKRIELLSPAKNTEIGIAAINNGADAVYIGAPAFGARKAASNSIEEIQTLVEYAHRFHCRVFVTLNTVIYDDELPEVEKLIHRLYEIGVDAIIIQDAGILKLNLPPISLHASTQMHNYDIERIKFLDKLGIQRIVLARELSLEQIKEIRTAVKAELEVFIHGALCVSLSGQCYLSCYLNGRSANRGECAQPCRMKWTVKDSNNKILIKDKHVLSLKDLNLSRYLEQLIEAGVDSFKIEGRLKDENYVVNTTNHYHSLINNILTHHSELTRVSVGTISTSFIADPERSFNRGYTDYFIEQRKQNMVNMDTPKSVGKQVGTVKQVKGNCMTVQCSETINNGDGLCWFEKGELKGIRINSVEGATLICNEPVTAQPETQLYRNYDHKFVMQLEKEKSTRKIKIQITAMAEAQHLKLTVTDETGITADYTSPEIFEKATNSTQLERITQQLTKCGDSDFFCIESRYISEEPLFIPVALINAARRQLLNQLVKKREQHREIVRMGKIDPTNHYLPQIHWQQNVVNKNAETFYKEHGADTVEPGFEKQTDTKDKELMRTRYCLLYELGRCKKENKNSDLQFPLYICNDKQQFRLEFECGECFMKLLSPTT